MGGGGWEGDVGGGGVKEFSNVHSNQNFPKTGDHTRGGGAGRVSPNQYSPPVWKKFQAEDGESGADIKICERY